MSVESSDLSIDEVGIVRTIRSGDFYSAGVPVGTNFPVEPELGAVAISTTVGTRIAALPRYRRLGDRYSAFSGIWTYQLESNVRLHGDHSGLDVDTNVVNFSRWASVRDLRPVVAHRDSMGRSRTESFTASSDGVAFTRVDVTRRADAPVSLETFALWRTP